MGRLSAIVGKATVAHPDTTVNSLRRSHIRNLSRAAAPQGLQSVPLSWKAAGGALLPVLVPVKPMVTDADGAMVRS
jgi:hypothetical protein